MHYQYNITCKKCGYSGPQSQLVDNKFLSSNLVDENGDIRTEFGNKLPCPKCTTVIDYDAMGIIPMVNDMVYAISKGLPGAIRALREIMANDVDPDDPIPLGLSKISIIDMLGIYGSDLWILYKYVCDEEIKDLILILRSYQLGFITADNIKDSICMKMNLLKMDHLLELVKSQLPNFNYRR